MEKKGGGGDVLKIKIRKRVMILDRGKLFEEGHLLYSLVRSLWPLRKAGIDRDVLLWGEKQLSPNL